MHIIHLIPKTTHVQDHIARGNKTFFEKEICQKEGTEKVRSKLAFNAFLGEEELPSGHDAGIVDEKVDVFGDCLHFSDRIMDGDIAEEVQLHENHLNRGIGSFDLLDDRYNLFFVAAS